MESQTNDGTSVWVHHLMKIWKQLMVEPFANLQSKYFPICTTEDIFTTMTVQLHHTSGVDTSAH